jgi:hypothetical protein
MASDSEDESVTSAADEPEHDLDVDADVEIDDVVAEDLPPLDEDEPDAETVDGDDDADEKPEESDDEGASKGKGKGKGKDDDEDEDDAESKTEDEAQLLPDAGAPTSSASSKEPPSSAASWMPPKLRPQHESRETYIGHMPQQSEDVIVIERDDRRTSDMASMFEFTEAISLRAEQIAADGYNAAMLRENEIPSGATTARDIAIAEIQRRKCPLKVIRQVGMTVDALTGQAKKYVEIWSMNELILPSFQ